MIIVQKDTDMKRVLIAGKDSYIGRSAEAWLLKKRGFIVDTLDMRGDSWRDFDFSPYDAIFHVAGIAHADTGRISEERKAQYYQVNGRLPEETAKKAKKSGVGQFIYMSSMIVYGESGRIGQKKIITSQTEPAPANFYGESKWEGDKRVRALADNSFQVAVIRPPMVYGTDSKGNYRMLEKLACRLPVFPDIENQRSMLHIDGLCSCVEDIITRGTGGVYFPQDREYGNTCELVRKIAAEHGHKILMTRLLNPLVYAAAVFPNRNLREMVKKGFGNMVYERDMEKMERNNSTINNEKIII